METNSYIVGIGEVLWDLLPEGKQLGGAPANFAYHASQLGGNGCVVSAIGQDELGKEILSQFSQRHLQAVCPQVAYPTGTVQVTLDAAGVPSYEIKEGVAWDHIPFTASLEELAHHTSAVCFGSLAQRDEHSFRTLQSFLHAMPAGKDVYKVFDINLRQHFYTKERIEDSLQVCNLLKINDEELDKVRELFDYASTEAPALCHQLLQHYELEAVILTCGVQGSYIFSSQEDSFLPTPSVKVADTVGAGDAFTAAFVTARLQGLPLRRAHQLAVDVSAYVCTQQGAMPLLPPCFSPERYR